MNLIEPVVDGLPIEAAIRCVAAPFEKLITSQEACAFLNVIAVTKNAFVEFNVLLEGNSAASITNWLNVETHFLDSVRAVEAKWLKYSEV